MKILKQYGAARLYSKTYGKQGVKYYISLKENGTFRRFQFPVEDAIPIPLSVPDVYFEQYTRDFLETTRRLSSVNYYEVKT